MPDDNGKFEAGNIETGTYELIIRQIWSRDNVNVGVMVKNDSTTEVNLVYPPPCLFTRDTHPKCKGGHTDNIVPIVYGLPTRETRKKSKRGKLYLGGCIITECDPHYYCLTHKMEL